MKKSPVLLIVLDGLGVSPSRLYNGWARAKTPHLDHYFSVWPHTVLQASGEAVGLPDGQFGNSEVGHLTLGAGRVLKQALPRISDAIEQGELEKNNQWNALLDNKSRLHLVGLVSDGGVHAHINHLCALLPLIVQAGIEPVIHMITDGRDTAPSSALLYLKQLEAVLQTLKCGVIATITGRYFAMDRASHWDRTQQAWAAIVLGQGIAAPTSEEAINSAYLRGESDEFIKPTIIATYSGIKAEEPVLFFNFRSDRMRQLTASIGLRSFSEFERNNSPRVEVVCMTEYDAEFNFAVLFETALPQHVLAQVISRAGLRQFHCAETEKYPHVTYFFNGGREAPFAGETRTILPSPDVATYDLLPQMSAALVAKTVIDAIESDDYEFVLVNFANTDMVGHTAVQAAIIAAVEAVDLQSSRIIQSALLRGWRVIVTADHGNCEEMVNSSTGEPHTQHTCYPVPFLLAGENKVQLGTDRTLADVAPTILALLGLPQPLEMTGRSLLINPSTG